MNSKKIQEIFKEVDRMEDADCLVDIARMMKDIVRQDKYMSIENKMKYLSLYIQYRQEELKKNG